MRRAAWLLLLASCGGHIRSYEPKRRQYTPPVAAEAKPAEPGTEGSLMSARGLGASLFTDARSFGVGDLITVRVVERASAERSTSTDLERQSSFQTGFDALGGLESLRRANPTFDPSNLLHQNTRSAHSGGGSIEKSDRVVFMVTAAVRQVLANGDLFIEGDRIVKLNDEEHHFYVSGVARPADVGNDNSIASTLLAEAEIEFFGEGSLSDKEKQGWFMSLLDFLWPF
jgi:flagellar L-ring protein precursor FlgH